MIVQFLLHQAEVDLLIQKLQLALSLPETETVSFLVSNANQEGPKILSLGAMDSDGFTAESWSEDRLPPIFLEDDNSIIHHE